MDIDTPRIIVQQLIRFGEYCGEPVEKTDHQTHLIGDIEEEHLDDEIDPAMSPLKFLFAVIFDQGIGYERAWKAPTELEKRLGHLDIGKISRMKQEDLEAILLKPPALHRFNNRMAGWIISASKLLLSKYDGRAEVIWGGNPRAKTLENRFREFEGISQKKGSMAVNILVRDYDLPISGTKEGIDVSYDVHVRRVFLRTCLVAKDTEEAITNAARQLNPQYPGALDYPAWVIGRKWCHRKNPECSQCVLDSVCPKEFQSLELL